ncbi:hypothetical protein ES703_71516 [subsurface metagenome]
MAENKQDILIRAYAMLQSLRKNIDQMVGSTEEKYVSELHTVLDKLGSIGIDVSEFRIPNSEIAPRVTVIRTLTFDDSPKGGADYSKEKYVDKSFILMKLDAILDYLKINTSEKPRKIGFSPSENQ